MKEKKINISYLVLQIILFVGFTFFLICWCAKFDKFKFFEYNKENCLRFLWCMLFSFLPFFIKLFKVQCTKTCETYFLIAIIVHFIAGGTFKGYHYSLFSSIVHFTNSFLMGVIIYGIILRNTKKQGKLFLLITTMACVALIGVLWELVEFSIDGIFGANMQKTADSVTNIPFVGRKAIYDTIADLAMDALGGFLAGILSNLVKIKKRPFYMYFELKSHETGRILFGETCYHECLTQDGEANSSGEENVLKENIEEKPSDSDFI